MPRKQFPVAISMAPEFEERAKAHARKIAPHDSFSAYVKKLIEADIAAHEQAHGPLSKPKKKAA